MGTPWDYNRSHFTTVPAAATHRKDSLNGNAEQNHTSADPNNQAQANASDAIRKSDKMEHTLKQNGSPVPLREDAVEFDGQNSATLAANGHLEDRKSPSTLKAVEAASTSETMPVVKSESSPIPCDTNAFLNFDLPEDTKIASTSKLESDDDDSKGDDKSELRNGGSAALQTKREDSNEVKPRKPGQPVSMAHLPLAEREAMATFEELGFSTYQNKQLGRTKQQDDSYICECRFSPNEDDPDDACGAYSGCINRLTQVECLSGHCSCGEHCQNQRFQKRQYAPIEIVKTEKKGFGMRAKEDIEKDAFIYEYVGEIIAEKAFQKRMKDYFDEGIRHFYFMMLDKEEYIDATKKGGKGRFLNHSCAPNCYVAKWVVGKHLRMGIFAKRDIQAQEELTFNYNVDRYGHDAQECFCGEPNCVGFIGGKTQTELAGMDDLYLDALGITDEVEKQQLKGTKKKKSRRLDEDFTPTLTPIPLADVPKVASAVRQAASNRRIVSKLLARILMTDDGAVQKQLMRMHGFSLMSTVLYEFKKDPEIITTVIGILQKWPLITRNKLVATNIESAIIAISERDDPLVADPAKQLLEMWQALEIAYRIPKSMKEAMESGDEKKKREAENAVADLFAKRARIEEAHSDFTRASNAFVRPEAVTHSPTPARTNRPKPPPPHWQLVPAPEGKFWYMCLLTKTIYHEYPSRDIIAAEADKHRQATVVDVQDIIAKARAEAEAQAAQSAEKAALEEANAAALRASTKRPKEGKHHRKEPLPKDKKMYKLFSAVVVATMSKYKKHLDPEQFKRRAKEVCDLMCEKEKKSSQFNTEAYDTLSPEKEQKIKKYVKEFTIKLLARKGIKVSSSSSASHRSSNGPSHAKKETSTAELSTDAARPSARDSDGENDDMDLEGDDEDDILDSMVADATGASTTPDSISTPQAAMYASPLASTTKHPAN